MIQSSRKIIRANCLLIFLWLGFTIPITKANGFSGARVTIDGLTCSMCSKSVEKAIRKLDFVANVKMDLNANLALISFVDGEEVSFHQIAKKIRSSGFSVREMVVEAAVGQVSVREGATAQVQQSVFCLVDVLEKRAKGNIEFKIIGEHFMPRKDWKKWSDQCSAELETAMVNQFPEAKEYYFATL